MRYASFSLGGDQFAISFGCLRGWDSGTSNGGNTPNPKVFEGRFIVTVVEGLGFSSGDQTGTTDSDGMFSYEVGVDVTFSVRKVEIGTVAGVVS